MAAAASSCIKKRLSLSNLLFRHIRHHNHHHTPSPNRYISTNTNTNTTFFFYNKNKHRDDNINSFLKPYAFTSCYRSFTTDRSTNNDNDDSGQVAEAKGFFDYNDYDYTSTSVGEVVGVDEAIVPVRCLVWFLDQIHYLTTMPWWMVIVMSTLALKVAILPVLLVQLQKLKIIAELAPKLPPPFPPPFSGKSWIEQYKRFREKRIEIGCPSFLWMLAYPSVQIPCFILGTASVRRMSLDHYPGFETGGALWFQNLTELPHGATGCIFPLLIATMHLVNVRLSFEKSSLTMLPNQIGVSAKDYRFYLHCLTILLFYTGFYLPQGSLIYWAANSSITLVQQLVMKHPLVREKLGLSNKLAPVDSGQSRDMDGLEATFTVPLVKKPIHELSLLEIFNLSIKHLSKEEHERAASLLR